MQFANIIGYERVKQELIAMARSDRIPHNILFDQEDGMPGIPLAIAWFQYLNCENPSEKDACGCCRHCKMISELSYPDLYFIYPVVGAAGSNDPSGEFFDQWKEMLISKGAYFSSEDWLQALRADNSRPVIYSGDAYAIDRKLSLHISENGYRMVIIYQPERMRDEMANKLLKLMEEPPAKTLFLSVSINPEQLLETVISRMQRIEIPLLTRREVIDGIGQVYPSLSAYEKGHAADRADGILQKALDILSDSKRRLEYTKAYSQMVRHIERYEVGKLKALSESLAREGREYSIAVIDYMEANFRYALRCYLDPNYPREVMSKEEQQIERYISGWVTPNNIGRIYSALEQAIAHIKGNVMAKIVLFDTFLALTAALVPAIKASYAAKLKQR